MARGFDSTDAHTWAGYRSNGHVKAAAARLLGNADVVARIAALRETAPLIVTTLDWAVADALRENETITDVIYATLAKAKIPGLLADKPESTRQRPVSFDGNYNEAVRRISLRLRLSENQQSEGGDR